MVLLRRQMSDVERVQMKRRLGSYWSIRGMMTYGVLKHTLHEAHDDPAFKELVLGGSAASGRPGMWLEFGVFRGTSINITAAYRDLLWATLVKEGRAACCPREALRASAVASAVPLGAAATDVHGFDTFTGLPEAWMDDSSGKRKPRRLYKRGAYSWAARSGGRRTPPVKEGVHLIPGLFNETLAPFLISQPAAPLA